MFINLTNHSIEKWSQEQIHEASKYGVLVDLAFPTVDPHGDECYIADLVDKYIRQIDRMIHEKDISKDECTVHVMGEMTFVYEFVKELKKKGMRAVASTTERNVEELPDGQKKVSFKFVQFREY